MSLPQGLFTFPGVTGVISASVTFAPGITPSVTSISIPPNPSMPRMGTAVWSYGGSVIRSLPNSAVTSIQISRSGGATIWNVAILDRRWMWEHGQISGEYNIRVGEEVIASSVKTPRELATLCLEAMGETGYNVSAVPVDDQPYVKWELETPARALAELLDTYGLTVSLLLDNTVAVVKLGDGAAVPGSELTSEATIDPQDLPKRIKVASAPVQWETDLRCEAVGIKANGEYVPINDLPYKPAVGWEFTPDFVDFEKDITDVKDRKLATDSVYRSYRVKLPATSPPGVEDGSLLDLPGNTEPVLNLYQILALVDEIKDTAGDAEVRVMKRSVAWGRYYDNHGLKSHNTKADEEYEIYDESLIINQSFSLDTELGIVQFSDPAMIIGEVTSVEPAVVFVRCSVLVRLADTRAPQRMFKSIDVDLTSPSQDKYVVRDDITPRHWKDSDGIWQDNLTEVEAQLDFYLSQELANYQSFPGVTADYAGFVAIANDGAILQVAYAIGADGKATSKVTRNVERLDLGLTYRDARNRQGLTKARVAAQRDRLKRPVKRSPRVNGDA